MKYKNILYSAMAGILLLASCAQTHENAEQVGHLPNMYPDNSGQYRSSQLRDMRQEPYQHRNHTHD